jgi:putative exosortase-associated protein (TIGR04073 family)
MNNASKAISVVFVMILLNREILRAAAANQTEQYPVSLEQKLGAVLLNATTKWVELVKTPIAISKKEGLGLGLTLGPVMGVGRTACSLFDVVTFVLPTKPLVEPNMVWQDF